MFARFPFVLAVSDCFHANLRALWVLDCAVEHVSISHLKRTGSPLQIL